MCKSKVILLFIFISTVSFSQGFKGKAIIGINGAQIDGDKLAGFNRVGPIFGAAVDYKLSKKVAIQMEIYYSLRGSRSTTDDLPLFIDCIMHYIDIPLIISIEFYKRLSFQIGLTPAYLINAQLDGSGYGYGDVTNLLNKFDICYSGGLEYAITDRWAVNTRFNYSAIPVEKPGFNNTSTFLQYGGWFNNFFNVSIRYTFPKKEEVKPL